MPEGDDVRAGDEPEGPGRGRAAGGGTGGPTRGRLGTEPLEVAVRDTGTGDRTAWCRGPALLRFGIDDVRIDAEVRGDLLDQYLA